MSDKPKQFFDLTLSEWLDIESRHFWATVVLMIISSFLVWGTIAVIDSALWNLPAWIHPH